MLSPVLLLCALATQDAPPPETPEEMPGEIPALVGTLGVALRVAVGPPFSTVSPTNGDLTLRVDYGPLLARVSGTFGRVGETFSAWSYAADRVQLGLGVGASFLVGETRLGAELGGIAGFQQVVYEDESRRGNGMLAGELGTSLRVPLFVGPSGIPVSGEIRFGVGLEWIPPAAARAVHRGQPYGFVSAGLGGTLF